MNATTHFTSQTLSRFSPRSARPLAGAALLCFFALLPSGCKKTISDADIANGVRSALTGDAVINKQPIQSAVVNGVVTLTGNVTDDTAIAVAAQDAARVPGVKEVVNSLMVQGIAVAPTIVTPEAPTSLRPTTVAERQSIARHETLQPRINNSAGTPAPVTTSSNSNSAPQLPPEPIMRDVTVPAGAVIPIRINQTLSSESTEPGTSFSGVVTHEVVADGLVVIPAGSSVSGRVVEAKDAGHFKGNSELSIELTSVRRHGSSLAISTEPYTLTGKGRGVNTAEKVGGGAAIGAVLGGIFGGGKGAAIGAAAGGGGGAAVQGMTHGQQVQIPSESLIRFRLTNSITVRTSESPSNYEPTTLRDEPSGLRQR